MKTPKAGKETAEQAAARTAEEERIRTMQARADADEAASGRRLLTKKTRQVVRLFGARQGAAGVSISAPSPTGGGGSEGGGGGSFPLGYGGGFGSGWMIFEQPQKTPKLPRSV